MAGETSGETSLFSRFSCRSDVDIDKLIEEKDSKSTKSSTKNAVKILREFCVEKGLQTEFENLSKTELNDLLKSFYANARKKDGIFYSKNSINSIRYGIARYLMAQKEVDIVNDTAFSSSNRVFSASLVELKRVGMAKVNHHPEITKEDLEKLYSSFNLSTPKGLQQKCFFDIMFHLVRRGRENLRQQTKSTFAFATDSQQRKYVYQAVDELDKNHRENDDPRDSTTDGRMYERPGPLCPVKSFEKYLSKLHPQQQSLWQRPKETATENTESWYCNAPLGKNTLGDLMKSISREANLSQIYTNHSIRATAVTVLDHSNVEARHIMRVSGHKSESSIRSYARRLSENKQREISTTLAEACRFSYCSDKPDAASSPDLALTSSQFEDALDTISSSPLPRLSLPGSPIIHASQTNSLESLTFASGAFNNCNITFNFNYK